jgi:hypothetical protein
LGPVNLLEIAVLDDLVGGLLRDQAQLALHLGERTLDVEVLGGAVFVRPDLAHFGVAEHVAEYSGINDACRHGFLRWMGVDGLGSAPVSRKYR